MSDPKPTPLPYVPDHDDLSQIERDLRFFPVENLTQGCLPSVDVFSGSEIEDPSGHWKNAPRPEED
jgi:hypothetical protein